MWIVQPHEDDKHRLTKCIIITDRSNGRYFFFVMKTRQNQPIETTEKKERKNAYRSERVRAPDCWIARNRQIEQTTGRTTTVCEVGNFFSEERHVQHVSKSVNYDAWHTREHTPPHKNGIKTTSRDKNLSLSRPHVTTLTLHHSLFKPSKKTITKPATSKAQETFHGRGAAPLQR